MTYEFQSTSNARLILVTSVATIVLVLFVIGSISIVDSFAIDESYNQVVAISIGIIGLVIIWLIGKKFLKQESRLKLDNGKLTFIRDGQTREFHISEIESYKYKLVKGVRLSIWTRRNEEISIIANDIYCDYESLEKFCSDFDEYINSIKTEQQEHYGKHVSNDRKANSSIHDIPPAKVGANEALDEQSNKVIIESKIMNASTESRKELPERKKSFYEKRYAQPFLIFFTILVIAFVIFVVVDGGEISGVIIASIGGLAAMWGGYFNHQKE